MLNKNTFRQCVLLTTCSVTMFLSTGCRSVPGRNLFGLRSEPSAEALAGSGPTTTYPVPPSATATPQAIASIAGGTAGSTNPTANPSASKTAQVAGIDITPGYATPTSASPTTNLGAAQANGFYDAAKSKADVGTTSYQAPATTPSFANTTPAKSTTSDSSKSGYTFGTKALTPKTDAMSDVATKTMPKSSSPSSYTQNASFTPPASSDSPKNSFAPPPTSSYTAPKSSDSKAASSSSGFILPTDSPAMAAISLPSNTSTPPLPAMTPATASTPDFSTASTAPVAAPRTTQNASAPSSSYMPGSTGAASGYPTGTKSPTTQGSFYR